MRQLAKERSDMSGEWVYRVRGPPGQMRITSIKKDLRILCTNADSLHNKLQELKLLISSLEHKLTPQIIAITEVIINQLMKQSLVNSKFQAMNFIAQI